MAIHIAHQGTCLKQQTQQQPQHPKGAEGSAPSPKFGSLGLGFRQNWPNWPTPLAQIGLATVGLVKIGHDQRFKVNSKVKLLFTFLDDVVFDFKESDAGSSLTVDGGSQVSFCGAHSQYLWEEEENTTHVIEEGEGGEQGIP